ncbi:NTS1 family protein [Salix suchowensis]|nr:NTS1 family protein [Salix suchowensis]
MEESSKHCLEYQIRKVNPHDRPKKFERYNAETSPRSPTTQLQKDHRAHLRSHRLELDFGEPHLPSFGFYSLDALFRYSAIIAMTKSGAKGKRPAERAEESNIQNKGKSGKRNDGATPLPSPTTNAPQNVEPLPRLCLRRRRPPQFPLTDVVIQARHELLSKTKELYAKMDPLKPRPIHLRETIGIGPEGWLSMIASIGHHFRPTYARPAQDGLVMKANEMYALAQRLGVEVEFSEEDGDIPPTLDCLRPVVGVGRLRVQSVHKRRGGHAGPTPRRRLPCQFRGHEGDEEEFTLKTFPTNLR